MANQKTPEKRVLVVAHGSRSSRWVAAVNEWFAGFARRLTDLSKGGIEARLSFLEITDPLFEDALKEEAAEKSPLTIFPFFLSRSGHAGDEIPELAEEGLGKRGNWSVLLPEDWEHILGANAERRLAAYGANPGDPVVVSGYGASRHGHIWEELVDQVHAASGRFRDSEWLWAPSGHFMEDTSEPLRRSLRALREQGHRRAAVLPLYLSVSSYQMKLIPGVKEEFRGMEILFRPDAILPDPEIEEWAARFVMTSIQEKSQEQAGAAGAQIPPPARLATENE